MNNENPGTLRFPARLKKRLREMATKRGMTMSSIIVLLVEREVEAYEEKERQKADRLHQEKMEKLTRRRGALAPPKENMHPILDVDHSVASSVGGISSHYEQHAKRVAEALDRDVREAALVRDEAVEALRKQFPLLHPPEDAMRAEIDRRARALHAKLRKEREVAEQNEEPEIPEGVKIITIKENA